MASRCFVAMLALRSLQHPVAFRYKNMERIVEGVLTEINAPAPPADGSRAEAKRERGAAEDGVGLPPEDAEAARAAKEPRRETPTPQDGVVRGWKFVPDSDECCAGLLKKDEKPKYRLLPGAPKGQGTFAHVYAGTDQATGEGVAFKIVPEGRVLPQLMQEITTLRKAQPNAHVVRLLDAMQLGKTVFLILELAPGEELLDFMMRNGRVPESKARDIFRKLVSGVKLLHQRGVAHRDLKAENIMYDDASGTVKLIDFGFAANMTDGPEARAAGCLSKSCGSPQYAAPELIKQETYRGPEVDVWALGVILYAMLCGHFPFQADSMLESFRKIESAEYQMCSFMSKPARILIRHVFEIDRNDRIDIEGILDSAFMK